MLLILALPVVYAGLCAALYLFQDKLIFLRQPLATDAIKFIQRLHPDAEELRIRSEDSLTLHGWFKRGAARSKAPLLIYFGGNAEEVSWMLDDFTRRAAIAVALVNYRGYGLSEGLPSESALFADSLAIYDALVARADVDASRVAVMGRSLGTGVATYLAAQRPLRAVVLVSPYDSLVQVAQSHYPLFPVSWLMRYRFDSLSRAPQIAVPMLALAGSRDTLVTPLRSRALAQSWKGTHRVELLDGVGHNDITGHAQFWPTVDAFLEHSLAP